MRGQFVCLSDTEHGESPSDLSSRGFLGHILLRTLIMDANRILFGSSGGLVQGQPPGRAGKNTGIMILEHKISRPMNSTETGLITVMVE
jgi:hypothetical protein